MKKYTTTYHFKVWPCPSASCLPQDSRGFPYAFIYSSVQLKLKITLYSSFIFIFVKYKVSLSKY